MWKKIKTTHSSEKKSRNHSAKCDTIGVQMIIMKNHTMVAIFKSLLENKLGKENQTRIFWRTRTLSRAVSLCGVAHLALVCSVGSCACFCLFHCGTKTMSAICWRGRGRQGQTN
jgi:hypothetical protein